MAKIARTASRAAHHPCSRLGPRLGISSDPFIRHCVRRFYGGPPAASHDFASQIGGHRQGAPIPPRKGRPAAEAARREVRRGPSGRRSRLVVEQVTAPLAAGQPARAQLLQVRERLGHCHPLLAERQVGQPRSEEHTSELQSRQYLVCRLLPEKKHDDAGRRLPGSLTVVASPVAPPDPRPPGQPPAFHLPPFVLWVPVLVSALPLGHSPSASIV